MGFFACFSRCRQADSKGRQNSDSARIFCLTRIGDSAKDISASDQVHLTETGAVFLGPIHHRPDARRATGAIPECVAVMPPVRRGDRFAPNRPRTFPLT